MFLRVRNVPNKSCRENINIHFVLTNFFPPESRSVSEVMWKEKHGMRCYVSPVKMVTRTRHNVMLYVHCLSCVLSSYVVYKICLSLISDVKIRQVIFYVTSGNYQNLTCVLTTDTGELPLIDQHPDDIFL
jgi:hypothetical protein